MRWIAVFLTTILAANAVSLDQFYGDRSCSCSRCGGDQCCEDKENYNCIYCDDIQDLSSSIDLTDQSLLFYGENYIYAYVSTNTIIVRIYSGHYIFSADKHIWHNTSLQ